MNGTATRGIADENIGAGGLCSTGKNRGEGEGREEILTAFDSDFSQNFQWKCEKTFNTKVFQDWIPYNFCFKKNFI